MKRFKCLMYQARDKADKSLYVMLIKRGKDWWKYNWATDHLEFPYCYLHGRYDECGASCVSCPYADGYLVKDDNPSISPLVRPLFKITEDRAREILAQSLSVVEEKLPRGIYRLFRNKRRG